MPRRRHATPRRSAQESAQPFAEMAARDLVLQRSRPERRRVPGTWDHDLTGERVAAVWIERPHVSAVRENTERRPAYLPITTVNAAGWTSSLSILLLNSKGFPTTAFGYMGSRMLRMRKSSVAPSIAI